MKSARLLAIVLLGLLLTSPAVLAATSAEELASRCESASGKDYCEGYIAGFYDGRTTHDYGKAELMSCPPTDESGNSLTVSYSQMALVFRKWAKDHPEKLHEPDWFALREAFAKAWPCKGGH